MKSATPTPRRGSYEVIGWREQIALPDLGIGLLEAKIDTGARTSALHADDQRVLEVADGKWVEFTVPGRHHRTSNVVRAPLLDERDIKNTSGVPERRLIVRTTVVLGRHRWHIEVSLANREGMTFDLILGRAAIRARRVFVDPGRSFLVGPPKAAVATAGLANVDAAPVERNERREK